MKNGKKPTRQQRKVINSVQSTDGWLVVKDTPQFIEIVHRQTGTIRVIPKN